MKEAIVNDYVNNYIGTMELSRKYGVSRTTIQRYLINSNVRLRKRTPKIKVNHFYFSEYNKNNCYWAGFILADGYIRTNKRFTLEIKLQKNDVNQLVKFKKMINYEGRVIERKTYYSLTISSQQIIEDLKNNFDILNKKSLTCFVSDKIPDKYHMDFICGYFDGDGSVTYTTTDTISFSGTKETLNFIRNHFFDLGIKLRSKDMPQITKNGNVYAIFYSGISAFKCLKLMYDNSTTYLDRKYVKYSCLIEKYE